MKCLIKEILYNFVLTAHQKDRGLLKRIFRADVLIAPECI